jgi:2-(1,2-epoxy-1,2-dihydrophenyl)acetyl-CoA isomerase
MSTSNLVLISIQDSIATITFNDPNRLNPLSNELVKALADALTHVANNHNVRALILTGSGKGFCSGADLKGNLAPPADGETIGSTLYDWMTESLNPIIKHLQNYPVPVLCALNGSASGAGMGLAMACDIIIAARSSYFYMPFMPSLGIVPDMGASWFLPRITGRARATALTLLGDRLPAEQAEQWGLIWRCVDDGDLATETMAIASRLAALPAHAAIETRRLMTASEANSLDQQLAYEAERQRELLDRPEFLEGVMAFMAKRKPQFPGRSE